MSRRKRQVAVVKILMAVAVMAVIGGIAFEVGRWLARAETSNPLIPVGSESDD